MRSDSMDFGLLSRLQLFSGGMLATIGMGLVFALVRDLLWLLARLVRSTQAAAGLHARAGRPGSW